MSSSDQGGSAFSAADRADSLIVQAFLRARAGAAARCGPFSLILSEANRSPFVNYAMPDDDAQPGAAEILALEEAFRARDRLPRLEYAPAAAPKVEAALIEAGFTVELRPPLMTLRADEIVRGPPPPGFDLTFVDRPARLDEAVAVAAEAFGGDADDARWLEGTVARGGQVLLAILSETGEAAGVGAFVPPAGGATEVVGIGVRPAFRRRGLAQAITAALSQAGFDAGCDLTWLSAAGEAQSQIYARAGYRRRAPMLFIAKPGA